MAYTPPQVSYEAYQTGTQNVRGTPVIYYGVRHGAPPLPPDYGSGDKKSSFGGWPMGGGGGEEEESGRYGGGGGGGGRPRPSGGGGGGGAGGGGVGPVQGGAGAPPRPYAGAGGRQSPYRPAAGTAAPAATQVGMGGGLPTGSGGMISTPSTPMSAYGSLGFSVPPMPTPDYARWASTVGATQTPVYRPSTEAVTGQPYLDEMQGNLSTQTQTAIALINQQFNQRRATLRSQLASQGLLDSGVGAQALSDLAMQEQLAINDAVAQMRTAQSEAMMQAHQQSIDNAFRLSGLDIEINNLGLNRAQVAQTLALNDAEFALEAQRLSIETGLSLAQLYDARQRWQAELSLQRELGYAGIASEEGIAGGQIALGERELEFRREQAAAELEQQRREWEDRMRLEESQNQLAWEQSRNENQQDGYNRLYDIMTGQPPQPQYETPRGGTGWFRVVR